MTNRIELTELIKSLEIQTIRNIVRSPSVYPIVISLKNTVIVQSSVSDVLLKITYTFLWDVYRITYT